jgi:stress-induced morphogen
MSIKVRGKRPDPVVRKIVNVLEQYDERHPTAQIEIYRHNSVSVRIRIVSSEFKGMNRVQREEEVWALLNELPEETLAELSLLLLLTPQETKSSLASREFDDPIPSSLK